MVYVTRFKVVIAKRDVFLGTYRLLIRSTLIRRGFNGNLITINTCRDNRCPSEAWAFGYEKTCLLPELVGIIKHLSFALISFNNADYRNMRCSYTHFNGGNSLINTLSSRLKLSSAFACCCSAS